MKNIKEVIIGIFAVIGFTAIVTGFTNEAEQQVIHTSPESHVWEHIVSDSGVGLNGGHKAHLYNKKTGEVKTIVSYNQKKGSMIVTYTTDAIENPEFK